MVQRVLAEQTPRSVFLTRKSADMDRQLPEWARRTNPVVRRHLGAYWKTLPPDLGLIVRLFTLQTLFILIAYVFPILFTIVMPTVTVSLVLLPGALIIYLQSLFAIGTMSAVSMVDERRKDTLSLMLIIPQPRTHLLYSKVAAAVWRQVENLGLVWLAVVLFSLPVLIIQYDVLISLEAHPLLTHIALIFALASSLLRLILEPMMIGALGVWMGATVWARVPAVVATGLLAGAYFFTINMLRLLPLDPAMRLFVDMLVPVIAPLAITFLAFRLAAWSLRRD